MRAKIGRAPTGDLGLRALAAALARVLDALDVSAALAPEPALAGVRPGLAVAMAASPHTSGAREGLMARSGAALAGVLSVSDRAAPGLSEPDPARTWPLVERAQAGDGEAFGQLYDLYVDSVYRFVYYRVHDHGLAEDLTSETFLRALRRIGTVEYQGRDIGAWFMTIARNLVFDHSKSARNRLEVVTGETIDAGHTVDSTEATVLAGITAQQLAQAVNQLGEEQRECIVLRFVSGLSVSETAAVMGKREGAIKAMQHRAVRRLAALLAEIDGQDTPRAAGLTGDRTTAGGG